MIRLTGKSWRELWICLTCEVTERDFKRKGVVCWCCGGPVSWFDDLEDHSVLRRAMGVSLA